MSDCRFILDNLNDQVAVSGPLITGSDVVDLSGAEMVAGTDAWQVKIKTVNPALQHPRLSTTVALYLDSDGRYDNNAQSGPRLGADQVYGIVSTGDGWQITREVFIPANSEFVTRPTQAKYSFENNAYVLTIPFAELPKDAKAYWRAGVAVKDNDRLTVDYVPDGGFSCAASLVAANPLAVKAKSFIDSGWAGKIAIYAVVIIALGVIFLMKRKNKKKQV
jgi:hypothetical protein